jgi:glycosyltransferase involved in cell wall biosynthesis
MSLLKNPTWLDEFSYPYKGYDDIPADVFDRINKELDKKTSDTPLVSIVITAWNEEVSVLRTIASLARSITTIPIEIIVVNNNSCDKTQQTIDRLHVKSIFQPIQGWGPARQLGLETAKGKYILMADADCLYPHDWIDQMAKALQTPGTVCVYGRYSFISIPGFPRWKLFFYEKMKDTIARLRHFKRPHLNAYGMSMGYIREYGLKIGYVMHKIRGEDGRLCFDLMQFGKVKQVKHRNARVWTLPRSLERDGNLEQALTKRLGKELKRYFSLFTVHPPHDTKTSEN